MNFENEADLQAAIAAFLVSKGHNAQREVPTGGGRVDILTERYLIEVKPKLSRSAQFQALGQLSTYDNRFPKYQKVIAGLTPSSTDSAYSTAERIRADGVEVWFMDSIPEFVTFVTGKAQRTRLTVQLTWWNAPYVWARQLEGTLLGKAIAWSIGGLIGWLWLSGVLSLGSAAYLLGGISVIWLTYEAVMEAILRRTTRR